MLASLHLTVCSVFLTGVGQLATNQPANRSVQYTHWYSSHGTPSLYLRRSWCKLFWNGVEWGDRVKKKGVRRCRRAVEPVWQGGQKLSTREDCLASV